MMAKNGGTYKRASGGGDEGGAEAEDDIGWSVIEGHGEKRWWGGGGGGGERTHGESLVVSSFALFGIRLKEATQSERPITEFTSFKSH
jgi:hypothetical protein